VNEVKQKNEALPDIMTGPADEREVEQMGGGSTPMPKTHSGWLAIAH